MVRVWIAALSLLLSFSCADRGTANRRPSGVEKTPESISTRVPVVAKNSATPVKEISTEVPPEFRGVDFRNFSDPTNWQKKIVQLKDGAYEHANDVGGETFDFVSVSFADVTDDGKQDAIVHLNQTSCGGSCDGGSSLFYFYSIKGKRPSLVWRVETGSLAYECGLKSFLLAHSKLTLEVFRVCQYKGSSFQQSAKSDDESVGKFRAGKFTRFVFEFTQRSVLVKERQVLPNPQGDILNYQPEIKISGD